MFRSRPEANEPGWKRLKRREPLQKPDEEGKRLTALRFAAGYNISMNEDLHHLNQTRWPFPALLHLIKIRNTDRAGA